MTSLAEALADGQGDERPFNCPEHGDRNASASVNVVKGVWYCYACHARGAVGKKTAPSPESLEAMLAEHDGARSQWFSDLWVQMIKDPKGYWAKRLGADLAEHYGFGTFPLAGDPVYLVHDSDGVLVGMVSRFDEPDKPKYSYPPGWAASRNLFGWHKVPPTWHVRFGHLVVLVESAADVAFLGGCGIRAYGIYGSGLHTPQVELLKQESKQIYLGLDDDEAGRRGRDQAVSKLIAAGIEVSTVTWSAGDPSAGSQTEAIADLDEAMSHPPASM